MNYTNLHFFLFLALTFLVFFICPKKYQWVVLLIASYYFYACASLKYIAFIILTTIATWYTVNQFFSMDEERKHVLKNEGKDWDRTKKKEYRASVQQKKKKLLRLYLILNLGILIFLKYYNFIGVNINGILHLFHLPNVFPKLKLFLPLGISFYTFQTIAYVTDVYNGDVEPEKNLFKTALFVSFFPQIIQGPISFFDQLGHQLFEEHAFDYDRMKYGLELMLWGFFQKMVIADRLSPTITMISKHFREYSGASIFFCLILYSFQLYADFAGGIDISRGIAQILGIDMIDNFRRPYFATSVSDFWRRWHISLGAFMKKYIFYPVAMSESLVKYSEKLSHTKFGQSEFGMHTVKVLPAGITSFIVFLVVGIWHGASWRNVGFGVWNGTILMMAPILEPQYKALTNKLHIHAESIWFHLFRIIRTYFIILLSYVFDIALSLRDSLSMLKRMFTDIRFSTFWKEELMNMKLSMRDYHTVIFAVVILFFVSLYQERKGETIRVTLAKKHPVWEWLLIFFCILAILSFGMYGPAFKASDFIYMQF